MGKRTIHIPASTEQLVETLGLTGAGWSDVCNRGIQALIREQPTRKVERALARISRDRLKAERDELRRLYVKPEPEAGDA